MKYLFIFLLILAVPLLSYAQDKPLCEQYTCVAQWNWGYQFGYGGGEDVSNAIFQTGGTNTIYLTGTTTILEVTH
jgi:hypothetical protein